jgi:hypothetical protein
LKYLFFTLIIFITILFLHLFNLYLIYPTENEVKKLESKFGNLKFKNINNLYNIQHKVIDSIKHGSIENSNNIITNNLKSNNGLCYDRSLILQKILLYNSIKIRPIFLFFELMVQKLNGMIFLTSN